jgi:hypothetical protein
MATYGNNISIKQSASTIYAASLSRTLASGGVSTGASYVTGANDGGWVHPKFAILNMPWSGAGGCWIAGLQVNGLEMAMVQSNSDATVNEGTVYVTNQPASFAGQLRFNANAQVIFLTANPIYVGTASTIIPFVRTQIPKVGSGTLSIDISFFISTMTNLPI